MPQPPVPRVAIVLPPGEAFAAGAAGAISLLAHRHASWQGAFEGTVFGTPPPTPPFDDVPFRPVQQGGLLGTRMRRYGLGVAKALRAAAPDLIEVHNRPELALLLASRCRPAPVTLILNNDPQTMRGAKSPADRVRLLQRLAGVACSSDYLIERLIDGIAQPPRHPVMLPNCLDPREVPSAPAMREKLILFAGRVVADKGADAFVAACARALPRLPGWRAEMVGGDRFGPDNPDTPFLRSLRPAAAAAGVAMRGYRPHGEVLAAMARAAIVVVPSRWPEPFGLTALEAMACGAALLCSNRGGLREVTGGAAVAIDPDAPDALGEAIVALALDEPGRRALEAAGAARARLFSLDAVGARLDAWRLDARLNARGCASCRNATA